MGRIFFHLAGLLAGLSCLAQPPADSADASRREPLLLLKFAPLSLLDLDNTFQAGIEYGLANRWSVQTEVGYGTSQTNFLLSRSRRRSRPQAVWRIRSEIRRYFNPLVAAAPSLQLYVALEVFYKRVNLPRQTTVGRDCDQGNCAYFEDVQFRVEKDVLGSHYKVGFQQGMSGRLFLDAYVGLGWRFVFVKAPDLPGDAFFPDDRSIFLPNINPTHPGKYRLLSTSLGLKVGYLILGKHKL
ncbi:MAG: DUF3575 domain-containing protein [Ferruginibacter sp.]|nr:DUF3575 domain-containing protein [Cytophagales bacterium]